MCYCKKYLLTVCYTKKTGEKNLPKNTFINSFIKIAFLLVICSCFCGCVLTKEKLPYTPYCCCSCSQIKKFRLSAPRRLLVYKIHKMQSKGMGACCLWLASTHASRRAHAGRAARISCPICPLASAPSNTKQSIKCASRGTTLLYKNYSSMTPTCKMQVKESKFSYHVFKERNNGTLAGSKG